MYVNTVCTLTLWLLQQNQQLWQGSGCGSQTPPFSTIFKREQIQTSTFISAIQPKQGLAFPLALVNMPVPSLLPFQPLSPSFPPFYPPFLLSPFLPHLRAHFWFFSDPHWVWLTVLSPGITKRSCCCSDTIKLSKPVQSSGLSANLLTGLSCAVIVSLFIGLPLLTLLIQLPLYSSDYIRWNTEE